MSLDSIFTDNWSDEHRSGVIAVVGHPNVGKSTLINAILGQKIAITTAKPQTTRRNQLGIYTEENYQILFTDTPGIHEPHNPLGKYMMTAVDEALKDADIILWIIDASQPPQKEDFIIAEKLKSERGHTPIVLVLNKLDATRQTDFSAHLSLVEAVKTAQISALTGKGVTELTQSLLEMLPLGPRYYPEDQVSDQSLRFIVAEMIREKAIIHTEQEVPHSIAVEIVDYKDLDERTEIYANICVERDSQKGIIVGKGGSMIKKIGTEARQDIVALIERPVYLDLHVKVIKNWRSDEKLMRRFGYYIPKADED